MLSYDQAAAKMQWRDAVRAVTEAIEDAGGVVKNVNDAKLEAVEAWIGESRRWLLDGLRLGRIDVAKANRATLAFGHHEDRWPTHGYEPTREAAMAAFAKSWRRE